MSMPINATKRYMRPPPQYVHDWFAPLRSVDVVPGKITNFNFMGHELIAFRDAAGKPVVLDAQCPHFGAHRGGWWQRGGRLRALSVPRAAFRRPRSVRKR